LVASQSIIANGETRKLFGGAQHTSQQRQSNSQYGDTLIRISSYPAARIMNRPWP